MNIDLDRLPIGGSEDAWLQGMERLALLLGKSVGARVELGKYWIDDFPGNRNSCAWCCVRGKQPVPGIESDSWEARLGWSANRGMRASAVAFVFPMLRASVVLPQGRLADRPLGTETDEFLALELDQGRFESRGWHSAQGPGEFARIVGPGDDYVQALTCQVSHAAVAFHNSILVEVQLPKVTFKGVQSRLFVDHRILAQSPRLSLLHINRDRENTNLVPWSSHPPRNVGTDAISLEDAHPKDANTYVFDLRRLRIRGGWVPGNYYFSLRMQNCHHPKDWTWSSDISTPLRVEIVE